MIQKRKYIWIFILVIVLFFFLIAFYQGLTIKRYTLLTDKLSTGSSICIVLITDLHSTIYGNQQQPLIEKIKQQNPDFILLAGDIVDDITPIKGTQMLLSGICDIAPIYYVTGNHEYWSHQIQSIRDEIQSYGVTILSDNYVKITVNGNQVIIAGIEDPDKKGYESFNYNQAQSMEKSFSELDQLDAYKILIAHRPEHIESYAKYPFDLVVSGHAHGGQVRIPFFLNGLYSPNQGWFPAYAGGLYEHGELSHIISRGLSINPKLPRIFNPPELVVISLKSDL